MECKTIAPMVVSGRSSDGSGWDARKLAYDWACVCVTHDGWDTNARATLRWNKRQAHKAERRSERSVITAELDQYLDDQAVSASWDAMADFIPSDQFDPAFSLDTRLAEDEAEEREWLERYYWKMGYEDEPFRADCTCDYCR